MKFLQLISDYGLAQDNTAPIEEAAAERKDVSPTTLHDTPNDPSSSSMEAKSTEPSSEDAMYSINERYLNKGRALSRPQNKAKPSSTEFDTLIRCISDNTDFGVFLADGVKLPPRLCSVVTHALALAPFGQTQAKHSYSTKNGVDDLLRHVSSLGRFGDTAFLIPMYGSGELSQAFCRSGAVFGSTYMLRRSPLSILVKADNDSINEAAVRAVVLSGEEHIGGFGDVDTDDTSKKEVLCSHVIVPSTMIPRKFLTSKSTRVRIYRRISILRGGLITQQENKDLTDDNEQRYVIVFPPRTRGLDNESSIHGVVVDDSAFVAPARKGYTLLHLTTSVFESEVNSDDKCLEILAKSVQHLIDSQSSGDDKAEECHHIAFSYTTDFVLPSQENVQKPVASGLHICYRDTQSMTCDHAFREAKRIFNDICPGAEFLALAKKVEDSIVYKNNDDSDDEQIVLGNALDMIQDGICSENKPSETNDNLDAILTGLANTELGELDKPACTHDTNEVEKAVK
jgi:hypothetical protein